MTRSPNPHVPPTPHIPPSGPNTGGNGPQSWPASAITVPDLPCGHLPGECDAGCAYWYGVAAGAYHSPDAYLVDGVFTIPPHAPGLLPLTDTALDGDFQPVDGPTLATVHRQWLDRGLPAATWARYADEHETTRGGVAC